MSGITLGLSITVVPSPGVTQEEVARVHSAVEAAVSAAVQARQTPPLSGHQPGGISRRVRRGQHQREPAGQPAVRLGGALPDPPEGQRRVSVTHVAWSEVFAGAFFVLFFFGVVAGLPRALHLWAPR